MRKIFKDTIEVKITLDTDDIKSICDNIAEIPIGLGATPIFIKKYQINIAI